MSKVNLLDWWHPRPPLTKLDDEAYLHWKDSIRLPPVVPEDKPVKIIIFNGPPNSGKDLAVNHIHQTNPYLTHLRFKDPLDEACARVLHLHTESLGWTLQRCREYLACLDVRERKEVPDKFLTGLSLRRFKQDVSEEILKPVFGKDIIAKQVATEIRRIAESERDMLSYLRRTNFLFSDGGFQEEVDTLFEEFGADNVLILQIFRDGCSFVGDTRNYIDNPDCPHNVIRVANQDKDLFLEKTNQIAREFFNLPHKLELS